MNTRIIPAFALLAVPLVLEAQGQTGSAVVTPSSPAPAVVNAAPAAPAPNQIVYTPRLPGVEELTQAAAAQGLTIERIEQSTARVLVVYKYGNGQTNTVAYQVLPPTGSGPASAGTAPVAATPVAPPPPAPPPAVYYQTPPRVYYYDDYWPGYYYDPYPWYPPVSFRFGFSHHVGFGGRHRHR